MNDLLQKIMAKKGADDGMDDDYKSSKLAVLQQLKDEMTKMMAGDLHGADSLKKVTVAAPDAAGLKDGLAKAQDLMGDSDDADADEDAAEDAGASSDDHEHVADDEGHGAEGEHTDVDAMSPEAAKALLKQLLAK